MNLGYIINKADCAININLEDMKIIKPENAEIISKNIDVNLPRNEHNCIEEPSANFQIVFRPDFEQDSLLRLKQTLEIMYIMDHNIDTKLYDIRLSNLHIIGIENKMNMSPLDIMDENNLQEQNLSPKPKFIVLRENDNLRTRKIKQHLMHHGKLNLTGIRSVLFTQWQLLDKNETVLESRFANSGILLGHDTPIRDWYQNAIMFLVFEAEHSIHVFLNIPSLKDKIIKTAGKFNHFSRNR